MANWLTTSRDRSGFDNIQRKFAQMLDDGRHVFDAAANALVGGTEASAIRSDLFETDERINRTEQEIRRMIVVHGTIHGKLSFPSLLIMMSLVKDAERIGDYAKNIFDLAVRGPDLGDEQAQLEIVELKNQISRLLAETRDVHEAEDESGARALLAACDRVEDTCDARLDRALGVQGTNAAGMALTFRYFKRVASHAANIATALVMPLDKLDFFDEP